MARYAWQMIFSPWRDVLLAFFLLAASADAQTAQLAMSLTVEITAYNSTVAQTDDDPTITASGAVAGPGTVAVSRDLLERFPYGSELEIISVSGDGCGGWVPETPLTVADTMNARIRNHVDVWLETLEEARNWGRCEAEIRPVAEAVAE